MSSYVEVRGVKIGEGVPKICVPIVGKTKEEILAAAKSFADVKRDVQKSGIYILVKKTTCGTVAEKLIINR